MKEYFKRLKGHPGIRFASFFTLIAFVSAIGNKNLSFVHALVVGAVISGIVWAVVLITNRK